MSLDIHSRHHLVHGNAFSPLVLEPRGRATLRYKLQDILRRIENCERLNPQHSILPGLRIQAQLQFNQVLSQHLGDHYNLVRVEAPCLYATPTVASESDQAFPPLNLTTTRTPDFLAPVIPEPVRLKLETFTIPHPWLLRDAWTFLLTMPRAKHSVHLLALVRHSAGIYKVPLAHDRSAGRLYAVMQRAASLPYQLSFAGHENRYDKPPGHIAQYILSNHGAV